MADEKNLNEAAENAVENAEETVKEAVEAIEETAEEIIEDAVEEAIEAAEAIAEEAEEEISEVDRAVAEALAERDKQDAAKKAAKNKKLKTAGIIAAAVIVVAGAVSSGFVSRGTDGGIRFNTYSGWLPKAVNKYNHMGYIDVTGNTIGDIAESMGMNVADFKEEFGMPEDMPASTNEMTAMYMMSTESYGAMYGIDFETMKDLFHLPDTTEDGEEITGDTPWGVVQGEISIADYVGDTGDGEAVAAFKEQFELGDEITGETKWKEVRNIVDEANRKARIESQKAVEKPDEVGVEDFEIEEEVADEVPADAAADGANAE